MLHSRLPALLAAACSLALVGCKDEPYLPDARNVDAFQPEWWTPKAGEYKNWDIQLAPPFNLTAQRSLYVLDLWAVAPASTITYADSSTLAVPAGPLAGKIAELHMTSPPTKVACMMRGGTVHLTADVDAMKFPGYEATPPDDPDLPAANSVVGWSAFGDPEIRWLDLGAGRAKVLELITKRIEFAKTIGCDAVVIRNNDRYATNGGWGELSFNDQVAWSEDHANFGHGIDLSVGVRNTYISGLSALAASFDFVVAERCAEFDDCAMMQPYTALMKPIFGIEYSDNPAATCQELANMGVQDGLIKMEGLDGSFAQTCE